MKTFDTLAKISAEGETRKPPAPQAQSYQALPFIFLWLPGLDSVQSSWASVQESLRKAAFNENTKGGKKNRE